MSDYNEAKAWAPSEERAYDDTKQPAPVDAALLRLDKAQAELREVITRLTERLAPVSSPTTVLSGGELATAVPRESRSPVVERIDQATNAIDQALFVLDAMPSSTAPKGWTRDDVLDELAKHPDNVCEWLRPIGGDWVRYFGPVEQWHPEVRRFDVRVVRSTPDPEWVPLHEVIGRTLSNDPSCDANPPIVDVKSGARWGIDGWFWTSQPFPHDDASTPWTTLPVTSDGTVAVRPEAET